MAYSQTRKKFSHLILLSLILFTANCLLLAFVFPVEDISLIITKNKKSDKTEVEFSSFLKDMQSFPWRQFTKKLQKYNSSQEKIDFQDLQRYSTLLLLKLHSYLLIPPKHHVNESCEIEINQSERDLVKTITSSNHCTSLLKPRKIGILLQFGFDVDTLEIHLSELNNFVDRFFIIESIKPHSRFLSGKPLMWTLVKFQDRFMKFADKVIHFVVDDSNLVSLDNDTNIWSREGTQEELRWEKFLEWNSRTNYFSSDDLLGFGDVDEIPAVDNIIYLKHCELPPNISSIDIGIWFPFDGLDSVFIPDYPVQDHPFTLGDPTFWTLASALKYYNKQENKYPSRMRGKSSRFLLGGAHLSRYAYPPYQLIKMLTATESSLERIEEVVQIGMLFGSGNFKEASEILNYLPETLSNRTGSMEVFRSTKYGSKEYERIVKIPKFLSCNKKRFPEFWKKYDPRLNTKYSHE